MHDAEQTTDDPDRRPLRSRGVPVFGVMASALARRGVTPNVVSVVSMVFAFVGAGLMVGAAYADHALAVRAMLLLAAAMVQGRLLCNMLDGMVADHLAGGTLIGRLFNEVPDRVSDTVLLLGLGWLVASPVDFYLGALAACVAALTAYIRAMAREVGAAAPFHGPMAKPQRMALLTAVLLALAFLPHAWLIGWWGPEGRWGLVESALWAVTIGGVVTCWRRLMSIAAHANAVGGKDDHA